MGFTEEQEKTLLAVARNAISYGLETNRAPRIDPSEYEPDLQCVRSSFVTLHLRRTLRGCVGGIEATQALVGDVAQHAYAAAFSDTRFSPVSREEYLDLDVHISVLTPSIPLSFDDEADLLSQLRPGVDGLTIAWQGRRATFLPTVWESLPEPPRFLAHLKRKGEIPNDAEGLSAFRYTTEDVPARSSAP